MNFDKEFKTTWNNYTEHRAVRDFYESIDKILNKFNDYLSIEPHEIFKLFTNGDEATNELVGSYPWPEKIFVYLGEELENISRQLNKSLSNSSALNPFLSTEVSGENLDCYEKITKMLRACLIISKSPHHYELMLNTSLVNQFLSTSCLIIRAFDGHESIREYFKLVCFLVIRVHDPKLSWFHQLYSKKVDSQPTGTPPENFKFETTFLQFMIESLAKLFSDPAQSVQSRNMYILAVHAYACILNESSISSNQNDNLVRAITPPIIDIFFNLFNHKIQFDGNESISDDLFSIDGDQIQSATMSTPFSVKEVDLNESKRTFSESVFYDTQLIFCRCLLYMVRILHSSLPDKRQVDLSQLIDRSVLAFEKSKRPEIKLEFLRTYLAMLNNTSDKAALKVVIASRKFFVCLLEQLRMLILLNSNGSSNSENKPQNDKNMQLLDVASPISINQQRGNFEDRLNSSMISESDQARILSGKSKFLQEIIFQTLSLIKSILDNSQAAKDIFKESYCYDSLFETLKETPVIDNQLILLIVEMIAEDNQQSQASPYSSPKTSKNQPIEKYLNNLVELSNCDMTILLIRLLPFMQASTQMLTFKFICRISTVSSRNQLKACKNGILFYFIDLLNSHSKLNSDIIEKSFRTIQILGRYSISHKEIKALIALLQPKRSFPYGIHVLRCLLYWSKMTTSIGLNLGLVSASIDSLSSSSENLSPTASSSSVSGDPKNRRSSVFSLNPHILASMSRNIGSGALSSNSHQQAKYFFDFEHSNSGIRVPPIKKWPGYAFTFHGWIKLRTDLELFDKRRRQLYSFYNDSGQGFEAFFTPDCASLVVSVCTKKEFLSVQVRELDFDSSVSIDNSMVDPASPSASNDRSFWGDDSKNLSSNDSWHSITVVHVPAKNPFGYSQVCIYVDGVLKKETDLKCPNFYDTFNHIRIGASCSRPAATTGYSVSNTLTAPLSNLKSVFSMGYKSSSATEKSLNVTSIPSGSQDTVWDPSTCLMGQMSSCFVLSDVMTDLQARLLYELGPNQHAVNWLEIAELNDIKTKFVLQYDAKCYKELTCIDLSFNKMHGKFSGTCLTCDNFKEAFNSVGSIQVLYPLLNYLSSNPEYLELICSEWLSTAKLKDEATSDKNAASRKSSFEDSEIEHNVAALILNLIRYMFNNNDIMLDRIQRNNGVALLSFLLQRLPKIFVDIHLLRICQEMVSQASMLNDKTLLNQIYEYIIFEFRIWNKADYEIRIGHIQYILTLIKDDKKYFRKKYGIQYFLDVIKSYFGRHFNDSNSNNAPYLGNAAFQEASNQNQHMSDEDLKSLRSSFFGLIKYYAQKEIKINEINAMISFLANTKNASFQCDLLDMLISLMESPNASDQLFLLLYEPNVADGLYSLVVDSAVDEQVQRRVFRLVRIMLKTKKVYEKSKSRLRLEDCGGYAGLVSKLVAEYSSMHLIIYQQHHYNGQLVPDKNYRKTVTHNYVLDLIDNFLLEEQQTITTFDGLWHVLSLLNLSTSLIVDPNELVKARLKACETVIGYLFTYPDAVKSMTKSPAWQDIICQLLCIRHDPSASGDKPKAPPIVISTNSASDSLTRDQERAQSESNKSNDESWESIDANELGSESEPKVKRDNFSKAKSVSVESESLITSTPSKYKKSLIKEASLKKTISEDQPENQTTDSESNQIENRSAEISNESSKINSTMNKDGKKAGFSRFDELSRIGKESLNEESQEPSATESSKPDKPSDEIDKLLLSQEANELFEKVVYLTFKLMWDGVSGSNDEAWKERCQIFSSLHRLSKEHQFIKPIEQIELCLLEMLLQRCTSDSKKSLQGKELNSLHENSREVIKLVDDFISKKKPFSEKLVSMVISLLDQLRAFDQKYHLSLGTSSIQSKDVRPNESAENSSLLSPGSSSQQQSPSSPAQTSQTVDKSPASRSASTSTSSVPVSLLNSYGIIHDEWAETAYLGLNILVNVLSSSEIEICAQASAKINTILHNRPIQNCEEACYLISSVERVMCTRLSENDEQHYAFLIPIMKSLIDKCYNLLQMNVQVPNIPFNNYSPTFYEDFKEYCKTDEWRIFVQKQVIPFKDQYLAMTINPFQMNMKIWWNTCYEVLMVSIHKRNRILGEAKIKFEDMICNGWKEREKTESQRFQNYLLQMKRTNLSMRKQLLSSLRFFTSEKGAWNEGPKDIYWMLSNHETRQRMRCKLIENLQFNTHQEASRLRDHSGCSTYMADSSTLTVVKNRDSGDEKQDSNSESDVVKENPIDKQATDSLTKKLQLNKEAINTQINEDIINDEEFLATNPSGSAAPQQAQAQPNQAANASAAKSPSSSMTSSVVSATSTSGYSSGSASTSAASQPAPVQQPPKEYYESQLEEKEKLLIKSECELITVTRVIKGRFELTNRNIYFFDTFSTFYNEQAVNNSNETTQIANYSNTTNLNLNNGLMNSMENQTTYSFLGFNYNDFDSLNDFKIPLSQLKEVQLRRYNLRRSALEFFLIDQSNFFINFNKTIRNKIYSKIISLKPPNIQPYLAARTASDLLKATEYTQKWCNHEMSNFEYLMKLNTIAGRSYNDLSQYPVFPWVLKDYFSSTLDLANTEVYRDLSKPIGVQNKKFVDYVRQKFELFEDPTGTMRPFHYGTHYSNSANVMHYLIRLEPFTTLHIQLQSDRFDVADRQFHSIGGTWRSLYDNPNDVKELIPEFYYLPEFLENMNNFDLGELQISKNRVNNVTLPPWAKNPEHFIYMHRKALESDYVSEHLHEWIDLVFGYKQQGAEAQKALNVFMYCSYEGAIDLDAITDPVARHATEGMISNFGQTPTQLLKEPHVKRKSKEQAIRDNIIHGRPVFLWLQIQNLKAFYIELCDPKVDVDGIDPVIYVSIPRNHVKSFMQQGLSDPLISITASGVIGVNGWQAYERTVPNLFSFEKDPSLLSEKTKKSIAGPFDLNMDIDHRVFILTHDSKLLISGGHWDNSLRVFSLTKYRNVAHIYQHSNVITCLAIDFTGTVLVSGSMDTTCMVWEIVQEYATNTSVNLNPTPLHVLYGHEDCVTSVDISIELDMIVSASRDGTVNIHTVRNGYYVKTLSLMDEKISRMSHLSVKLSNQRHLLVYTKGYSHETTGDASNRTQPKTINKLSLFSVNGKLIFQETLAYEVQDMIIKDDYCILAAILNSNVNTAAMNQSTTSPNTSTRSDTGSTKSASFQSASKIVFKECYGLKTIQSMRLKAPITCLFLTQEDSHLLVGLKDGKLIVITGDRTIVK